ncbi:MAG: 50S ribosomal protein L17, partial [Chloroflexi bacterium]|nr:50S ribosomal protein L17 [Chloroflexota bacterium]
MRHRVYGKHLKRSKDQRRALFRNLVQDLFRHGKIHTTQAKAKAVQPEAERLITLAKRGDLAARRLALRRVPDPKIVEELFENIAPRYA